jgi:hypothetical protein
VQDFVGVVSMTRMQQAIRGRSVISTIIQMANPVFVIIVVFVPIAALVYALNFGPLGRPLRIMSLHKN